MKICIYVYTQSQSFQQNRHVVFPALVALNLLVSLISRFVACSPRIVVDTHTHTERLYTVTLAVHARRGLITKTPANMKICIYVYCHSLSVHHHVTFSLTLLLLVLQMIINPINILQYVHFTVITIITSK